MTRKPSREGKPRLAWQVGCGDSSLLVFLPPRPPPFLPGSRDLLLPPSCFSPRLVPQDWETLTLIPGDERSWRCCLRMIQGETWRGFCSGSICSFRSRSQFLRLSLIRLPELFFLWGKLCWCILVEVKSCPVSSVAAIPVYIGSTGRFIMQ